MSRHQYLAPRGPPPPVSIPSKGISRITKSTQACDKCRLSRRRCNGATPCASCYASQIPCEYSHTDGRKKERFKAQIKALEERNAYLEQVVQQLSVNRADGAVQQPNAFIDQSLDAVQRQEPQAAAQQALPERPRLETSASIAPSGEAACGNHATHQSTSEADLQHMFYVATATRPVCGSLRLPYRRVQTDQRHKLPEKHVTRQALGAFFQCAATLFYVTTEEKSTQLLNKVYDSNIASLQDICELCALAAIGSHYKVDDIPDEARATYFFMASTSLHEAIEADGIQGMRIFICLCMSMVMEKCSIARLLIISALNLARGKMVANLQRQRTASTGSEEDEHRRTLQTLLFLEGWLSFSLGYRNCLNKSEIDLVYLPFYYHSSPRWLF
ncbi:hypothetical protein BJY04DRAFT_149151 [Aspergillus karnatakaensis]|uniref:uncharacterized protein n=1 Tax=Aspergillus karnatakaensis TaxID=1810916 RepID=UPI003CCE4E77